MESMQLRVSDLFVTPLRRWGLRGDPSLWQALGDYFDGEAWPDSAENFHEQLITAFTELTGYSLDKDDHLPIERFNHGGMSSGMIDPKFWREIAFPILLKSYRIAAWRVEHALEILAD